MRNNECVCPKGSSPKQTGTNAYVCAPNITCVGGRVKDGKCVCPKGTTVTSTGANAFACVKAPTGGATQGSTGGATQGATGGTSEGQTGSHPPTFVVPQGGLIQRR